LAAGRIASVARRVRPLQVALGIGALAFAASGLFGGLAPAGSTTPRPAPGQATDAGPWRITVEHARLFGDLPPLTLDKPGDRWLDVLVTIEVTTDTSRIDVRNAVQVSLPGLTSAAPAHVILARDGAELGYLNPGMPERVAYLWEQAASGPVPTRVEVKVYGKTWRVNSFTGGMEWLDESVHALVQTPVEDRRAP
jgi:hypothetical protein